MRIGRCRRLPWMLPCLTTTSSTAVFFGTCLLLLLKALVLCLRCACLSEFECHSLGCSKESCVHVVVVGQKVIVSWLVTIYKLC